MLVTLAALATPAWGDGGGLTLDPPANVTRDPRVGITLALRARDGAAPVKYTLGTVKRNGAAVPTPAGITLGGDTGIFTWTPTESQSGLYEIEITAKDGYSKPATTSFRVTVLERPITGDNGPIGKLLKQWYVEGTAAGNLGDFYDNRDRDHSPLHRGPWPQLDQVVYTAEELAGRRDWAAQHKILPHVTFGNSSTSAPVTMGGSNIRMYMLHPRGVPFLYEEYRGNNLYMYPAHHDHHPGRNGHPFYGDVFPGNTPYLIGSQGSSGTDQPFMRAVPFTLAAFRPDVKKKLVETGLLMPTVQMIFRMSNNHLKSPDEYLTGKAHPTIFEGSWVDAEKMVKAAHEITLDKLPPMVQMKVVEEDEAVDGKDYFEAGKSEKLYDTPCAIARIVRSPKYVRRMVVSAEASFDANKKPLTYKWVVLRGDAKRIHIKPKNDAGSVVELLVPYHDRRVIPDSTQKIESNRVDIGLFVNNGSAYSAPGFVTFYSLDNEARTYDKDGKLIEIEIGYGAGEARLTVSDWKALFAALEAEPEGWALKFLFQAFKPEERTAIGKVAEEYRTAFAKLTAAKQPAAARDKARNDMRLADEKLKVLQKAHTDKPTEETAAALKAAKEARATLEATRQAAEEAATKAQKDVDVATRELDAILTQKKPGLDAPVKELMEKTFAGFRDDASFYLSNRAAVEELLSKSDAGKLAAYTAMRKRHIAWGIMKDQSDAIHSIRTGDAPLAQRLTSFEKDLLRRFQAEFLAQHMYPKFLTVSFTPNFVDQRLAARKDWRDIFDYDDAGKMIGWTRITPTSSTKYSADGRIVLEKDDRGRPTRAMVAIYEYGPDGKVKIVREEKFEEKK
jgi:hypothetical protein